MNHLKIIQGNLQPDTEEVDMTIINKLYELASSGDLDAASELKGYLHLQTGDRAKIEYLTNMFQNKLFITANNYLIPFEDQNMVTYLNSIGVGSNGVITEDDASAATIVANSANTTVTKFNELKYFTQITQSRGGLSGWDDGWVRFAGWTALEEVDISNFTSIGHNNGYGWGDTFKGCSSLKKVIASDKLADFGYNAFCNCQNLEEISGLDGTITVYRCAFYNCQKLKNSCFSNVEILFPIGVSDNESREPFNTCSLLTNITLSSSNTYIPMHAFRNTSLNTINIPSGITDIGQSAFQNTNLQTVDLSATSITQIKQECFRSCEQLTTVTLPSTCTSIDSQAFNRCFALTSINLGNVTSIGSECFVASRNLSLTSSDFQSMTSLGDSCFNACTGITGSLSIPHLSNLGVGAFRETGVQSIDFTGSTFTQFSSDALYKCPNLTTVTLPSSCTSIGSSAFAESRSLSTINLGNITAIGNNAFNLTGLSGIITLSECLTMGEDSFAECSNITEIHAPKLTSISIWNRWRGANLEVIDTPVADIIRVGNCPKLTTINAPLATKFNPYTNGQLSLEDCPLLSTLNIDFSAVTVLQSWCFSGDAGLNGQYLEFPNVTTIGQQSLGNGSINFIFSSNTMVTIDSQNFDPFYNYSGIVYVPDGLVATYKADSKWSLITNQIKGISELPAQ